MKQFKAHNTSAADQSIHECLETYQSKAGNSKHPPKSLSEIWGSFQVSLSQQTFWNNYSDFVHFLYTLYNQAFDLTHFIQYTMWYLNMDFWFQHLMVWPYTFAILTYALWYLNFDIWYFAKRWLESRRTQFTNQEMISAKCISHSVKWGATVWLSIDLGPILSYTTVSALMVSRQLHKIYNSTIVHTTTLYLVHI